MRIDRAGDFSIRLDRDEGRKIMRKAKFILLLMFFKSVYYPEDILTVYLLQYFILIISIFITSILLFPCVFFYIFVSFLNFLLI